MSARFSRTQQWLKNHPLQCAFFDDKLVYIFQGDCQMYWRMDCAGHSGEIGEAGTYGFAGIWPSLRNIDATKKISVQIVSDERLLTLNRKYKQFVADAVEKKYQNLVDGVVACNVCGSTGHCNLGICSAPDEGN